ncbi:hypothetical protein [Cellulomonas hominis]|uniref:hypothetical protein n=1 Tax=Cellulomonas hominis TaxID=156981 RepID=UPI001B8F3538|nr:hypothetical protein [Cellulomonas hominis]VTR76093.1 hypothetical protein CHMI_00849 [Cellulomonas hominis]
MRRTRSARLTFDLPVALLELLYVRAALALDVLPDVPQIVSAPQPVPPPPGAEDVWVARYRALVDKADLWPSGGTGVLTLVGDDSWESDAQTWIREQRETIITTALTPTGGEADRLMRRSRELEGSGIERVYVVPVDGAHMSRAGSGVLLVSLTTFLDDDAWQGVP